MSDYYYKAKKVVDGMVTVRGYNLNEVNNSRSNLFIVYNRKKMKILHSQLKEKALKIDDRTFMSKFNNKMYKVYHFRWKPE